jgi:hypothetical protein
MVRGTIGYVTRGRAVRKPPRWSADRRRPVARDGPCLANTVVALRRRDRFLSAPLGAPPTPRGEGAGKGEDRRRRETPQEKEDERRMRRRGEGNRSRARERAAETGKVWFGNDVDEETKSKASIRGSTDRTRATDAGPTETRPRSEAQVQPAGSEGLRHTVPPCAAGEGISFGARRA